MQRNLLLIVSLLFSLTIVSQTLPEKQNPPRLVNDFAGILSQQEVNTLENYLVAFDDETSTQIAIVTVSSLDGTEVSDYAFKLGEKWGIGQKGKNNGIIILVKPKYGNERGQVFIATGYGLEGAVPDATAHQIVDNEIIPHFKQGDYFGGISSAITTITELTRGEYTADEYTKKHSKNSGIGKFIAFLIFFVFIIILRVGRTSKTLASSGSSLPFWLLMGGMMSSSNHHGSYGNFSSGSGGFGGFGGGGFGGGGAGGSW